MRGYVATVLLFGFVCICISFFSEQSVSASFSASEKNPKLHASLADDDKSQPDVSEENLVPPLQQALTQTVESELFRSIEPQNSIFERSASHTTGWGSTSTGASAVAKLAAVRKRFSNSNFDLDESSGTLTAVPKLYEATTFQHTINFIRSSIRTGGSEAERARTMARQFTWSPGGVRGASLAEMDASLDRVAQDAHHYMFDQKGERSDCLSDEGDRLRALLLNLSATIAAMDVSTSRGDDCRYFITPLHRAACAVMGALDDDGHFGMKSNRSGETSSSGASLLSSPLYRSSNCRVLAPCADWARGRFSVKLSPVLLQQVYEHVVLPSIVSNASRALAVQAYSQQLLHGEGNMDELPWLMRRSKTMDEDLKKRNQLANRLKGGRSETYPTAPIPIRDVFQGALVHVHASDYSQTSTIVTSGGTVPQDMANSAMLSLSKLEMLASLWVMVGPSLEGGTLNVMVFNGDSVNREVFHRLIHFIRFGDDTRPTERDGNGAYFPHLHYATHYDMVYAVHPEYDELLGFHSPQTNGSSTYTVERYFRAVRRNVTRWQGSGGGGEPPVALLYIVWFWDPFTTIPRGLPFGPHGEKDANTEESRGYNDAPMVKAARQSQLAAFGVDGRVVVQGTAFWERFQGEPAMVMIDRAIVSSRSTKAAPAVGNRRFYLVSAPTEDLLTPHQDALIPRNYNTSWSTANPKSSLRVSSTTPNFNIRKNIGYFRWLRAAAELRHDIIKSGGVNKSSPLLHFSSLQMLDKAKMQFIGEPMGDKIHFTCRGAFASGKPRFFQSAFVVHALEDLLGAHEPIEDRKKSMCNGTTSVFKFVKRLSLLQKAGSSSSSSSSSPRGHQTFCEASWFAGRMDLTRLYGNTLAGSLLPSSIMHHPAVDFVNDDNIHHYGRQPTKRTVVYVYLDGSRRTCLDPGDALLVQTMVHDAVVREAWAKASSQ